MTPNPAHCPLCGQGNRCAMEIEQLTGQKQDACWCTGVSFSAELLARVPAASQHQACICAECVASGAESDALSSETTPTNAPN